MEADNYKNLLKMIITLLSKFDKDRVYLEVEIDSITNEINLKSDLSLVESYYKENINNSFDFSYFDENGFHEIVGSPETPLHNLLVLLAYDSVTCNRTIKFVFNNESFNPYLEEGIIGLIELLCGQDSSCREFIDNDLTELSIFLYFEIQKLLMTNKKYVVRDIYGILKYNRTTKTIVNKIGEIYLNEGICLFQFT